MLVAESLSTCHRVRLSIKNRRQVIWREISVSRPLAHCYAVDETGAVSPAPFAVTSLRAIARLFDRHGFKPAGGGFWERAA